MTGKEVVNYKGLRALGIPYSRVHIGRLESNARFPASFKLQEHRNSPRVWRLAEVFEWLDLMAKRLTLS
jgi:predicted DNA-binding transcriptional regulator AlpA